MGTRAQIQRGEEGRSKLSMSDVSFHLKGKRDPFNKTYKEAVPRHSLPENRLYQSGVPEFDATRFPTSRIVADSRMRSITCSQLSGMKTKLKAEDYHCG
jgi:hypothetical protein